MLILLNKKLILFTNICEWNFGMKPVGTLNIHVKQKKMTTLYSCACDVISHQPLFSFPS